MIKVECCIFLRHPCTKQLNKMLKKKIKIFLILVPNSVVFLILVPSSRTRTKSLSITVGIQWATVMTVHPFVCPLIVSWITISVAVSIEAVASSKTRLILLFFRSTSARHTSCLCPTLQFSPCIFSNCITIQVLEWIINANKWAKKKNWTLVIWLSRLL